MTDLSQIPDDQLLGMLSQGSQQPSSAQTVPDLSSMSDTDLMNALRSPANKNANQKQNLLNNNTNAGNPNQPTQHSSSPSRLDDFSRQLGLGARYLTESALSPFTMVGDAVNAPLNATLGTNLEPSSQGLDQTLTKLGLPQPTGRREQAIGAASRGAGSAAMGAGIAGAVDPESVLAARPLLQMGSGATGGASAEGARQAGAGPTGQIAAGLVGGMAPYIAARSVGAVTSPVTNAISNRYLTDADTVAENKIAQQFKRDNVSPNDVQNNLEQLGPNATISDAAGRNTRAYTRTLAGEPGEGQDLIPDVLGQRQAEQAPRISQSLRTGMGGNQDYLDTLDNLFNKRTQESQPLYEKAFSQAPVSTPRIQEFLQDPELQAGIRRGMQIQRLEARANNTPFSPMDYGMEETNPGVEDSLQLREPTPNMRLLNAGKKGLDAMIQDNTDPTTGRVNELGRALTQYNNSYVSELKNINPDYEAALNAWGGRSQSINALNMGKNFVNEDTELSARQLANLPDADKDFFRVGAQKAMQDKVASTPDGADVVKRIFGNSDKRAKLQATFPDQNSFNQFSQQMKNESQMYKNGQFVMQGSQTREKLANAEDAIQMPPLSKGAILSRGLNWANDKLSGMSPEAKAAAARKLVSTDPNQNQQVLSSIAQRQQPPQAGGFAPTAMGSLYGAQAAQQNRGGPINKAKGGPVWPRPKNYSALQRTST